MNTDDNRVKNLTQVKLFFATCETSEPILNQLIEQI